MKILIINTVPTEKNGITGVIFNYLKVMETNDMVFDLLSLNNPEHSYIDAIEGRGGSIYVLQRLDGTLKYWIKLIKLINQNKYEIVHIHGNSHLLALELSAAYIAGNRIRIVHSHNTTCKHLRLHQLLTPLFKMLCTHALACGREAGRWMFGKSNFSILNNGVDVEKYSFNEDVRNQVRAKHDWESCKVIGHVGMFIPAKNQKFIIELFKELYRTDKTYRLLLIGDGYQKTEVEAEVKQLGLKKLVTFMGNVDNVSDYLSAMDVVVMPSLYEGLPLTLIEQQANGLPCVVADTITREADKTGNLKFLSLKAPVEKWIEAVIHEDGISREERSKKSIEDITKAGYNIKEQAKKLERFYLKCIQ